MIADPRSQPGGMNFEYYPTPDAFTRWLFREVGIKGPCLEACAGDGAIVRAAQSLDDAGDRVWMTNDLDQSWPTQDLHLDAGKPELYEAAGPHEWNIGNPPFTSAIEIIDLALQHARVGVAMHLRASIHEVLKTGVRRTWMAMHPPSGILWLPRFAYQRSKKTGEWTTDSVCACWCVWLRDTREQFIRYAPECVIDELSAETPDYRERMDRLMAERASVRTRGLVEGAA